MKGVGLSLLCVGKIIDWADYSNKTECSRILDPRIIDFINHLSLPAFLHVGKVCVCDIWCVR